MVAIDVAIQKHNTQFKWIKTFILEPNIETRDERLPGRQLHRER